MRTLSIIGASIAAATCVTSVHANHVDFLVDGPFLVNDANPTQVIMGSGDNILGGSRLVDVDAQTGAAGQSFAQLLDGDTFLDFVNDGLATSALTLDYGDFAGGVGELNSDFDTNWDAIVVNFSDVVGDGLLTVAVESSAGNGVSAAQTVMSAGTYSFFFNEAGFSGVDFTDVDRVTITLQAGEGADFRMTAITREIPAPGALAVLGIAAVAGRRRRR